MQPRDGSFVRVSRKASSRFATPEATSPTATGTAIAGTVVPREATATTPNSTSRSHHGKREGNRHVRGPV
jgi:hypothetical protein